MSAPRLLPEGLITRAATVVSLSCTLLVASTASVVFWPRLARAIGVSSVSRAPAYRTGERVDVPSGWYRTSPYTLVIFARASCGACQQAQPFFTQLVSGLKGRAAVTLATTSQSLEEDVRFGHALGLPERAVRVAPEGLRVRVTPTLLLVNQDGGVVGAWEGVGPPEQQASIAKAIDRAMTK